MWLPKEFTTKSLRFMRRAIGQKRIKKTGLPPGSVVFVGERKVEKVTVSMMDYDAKKFSEKQIKNIEECRPYKDKPSVTWINVNGLHETGIIEKLGDSFGIHPLILEDIVNTEQRPKLEDMKDYVYFTVKILDFDEKKNEVVMEHVSFVFGKNFLITFKEGEGDIFESVKERIRNGKGNIRKLGPDYLVYRLIDTIVDNYFNILEKIGDKIAELEEKLLTTPTLETLQKINELKRELIFLRKSVWPLREVIGALTRYETQLVKEGTILYFRDVYDHTIQVIDGMETFRDVLSSLSDLYLSTVSNKMNEVIKVLTIIATIFIPLTFIVGVYGMNFKYMPELEFRYGYFVVLGAMALITVVMIIYFRIKKWI